MASELSDDVVKRDASGRLVKGGGSLNRSGLDRKKAMMLRNLEALTPRAIATLGKLLDDPNPTARFSAAREILDRNLGRVKQSVQVDVDVTSTHVLHLQALEQLAARKKQQQIIDAQAIDITDNATLGRVTSHDGTDGTGAPMVIDASETVAAETPRPPEAPGAAACAATPPPTHENP